MPAKKSPSLTKLQKELASCNERNRKLAAKLRGTQRTGGAVGKVKDYLFGKPAASQAKAGPRFVSTRSYDGVEGSEQGKVRTSFAKLRKLFGEPLNGDDYKTTTEWVVIDQTTGARLTIYDWKATTKYGYEERNGKFYSDWDGKEVGGVAEFRRKPSYDWHIGAKSTAEASALKKFISGAK